MRETRRALLISALALSSTVAPGLFARTAKLERIAVFPPDVRLETRRDRQSIVVQATYDDGITRDVTSEAKLELRTPGPSKLQANVLHPVADGRTELQVDYEGRASSVPVEVVRAKSERPVSFKLDVMPVFTKAGCNKGSCHGASRGKDGFRLSLFGFDPEGDYRRLTREIAARRINLALPHDSLILEKAAGRVSHTGGKLLDGESGLYRTILRWLESAVPEDDKDVARPTGVELYPPGAVLNGEGAEQRLAVRARYSDGTDRDVTSLAYFMSSNENSAKVSQEGIVKAGARGEAFIMARFSTFTVGVPFVVLPKDLEFRFPEIPEHNYIDALVHQKLRKLRIATSELCSDEVFLRRVFIDITGTLPSIEDYEKFVASNDPQKRGKLVDELLGRKEFVELWVLKWAELLQIRSSQRVSYKAMLLYYNWLQEKLSNNVPMDRMVSELLSSQGGSFRNPATNYYQNETDTLKIAENIAQVFMGMRIQCAQCHNHPFDRWTQDDYYGFAAFFSQVGRKRAEDPRETIVFNRASGEVKHPVGGRVMRPRFLGGDVPDLKGRDRRSVVAEWLVSPDNPFFARNLANIVWAHFFGRGIIHEVDDVRVSNPPSNGELLEALGRRFTEYKYDFKRLVRDICTSRTYQLSTTTNATNEQDLTNFSHGAVRRIRAEVLLDCISQVTETKEKFRGLPLGSRAVQIADGSTSNYFLRTFGRAVRETVCSCEVKVEPTLSQALHLINGGTVTQRIQQGKLVERRLGEGETAERIIEEIAIRTLSRKPTDLEWSKFKEVLAEKADRRAVLEDIFWSFLNSREFLFNH